jgi:glyoxylase-like metal-dependent hydrolase (beta-lactamase superfamily II)
VSPPTVVPVLVAELLVEGERWPVCVHVIDHPDACVLIDTGMTELHPAVADLDSRLVPLSEQNFDLAGIDVVINTHLHFDHCGGNHLFAGRPSANGWVVVAVWESKAIWEKFRDETLLPAFRAGQSVLPGPPKTTEFEVEVEL